MPEFRPLPAYFTGYLAGDDGRIYSQWVRHGRAWVVEPDSPPVPLAERPRSDGYRDVSLNVNGVRGTNSVHVLVCAAFHGPAPLDTEASHLNGDPSDNRPSNLGWETHVENLARRERWARGETHGRAKLSASQVREIRALVVEGVLTKQAIANRYGVGRTIIRDIASRKRWAHLD